MIRDLTNQWRQTTCALCNNAALGICLECVRHIQRYANGSRDTHTANVISMIMADPGRVLVKLYARLRVDWPRPWEDGSLLYISMNKDGSVPIAIPLTEVPFLVHQLLRIHVGAGRGTRFTKIRQTIHSFAEAH